MSIARGTLLALALAALAAGCGGDEPKSDEDRAGDVAKRYVHSHSNSKEENCAETLAARVDPKLCGDLGPVVSRNNPEEKETAITGTTARVTVTGAGDNTRIEVTLVKEGEDWKVRSWRGFAIGPAEHE